MRWPRVSILKQTAGSEGDRRIVQGCNDVCKKKVEVDGCYGGSGGGRMNYDLGFSNVQFHGVEGGRVVSVENMNIVVLPAFVPYIQST